MYYVLRITQNHRHQTIPIGVSIRFHSGVGRQVRKMWQMWQMWQMWKMVTKRCVRGVGAVSAVSDVDGPGTVAIEPMTLCDEYRLNGYDRHQ